jgi:hypothetical protein
MLKRNDPMKVSGVRIQQACQIGKYVVLCCVGVLTAGCQEPPIHELQEARQAVERAKREGAYTYAPDLYSLAESELAVGEEEIHTQADKIFWKRDYSMATRLMNLAQADAHKALSLTEEVKQKSSINRQEPAS